MAKNKSVTIKRKVDIVILIAGWEGGVIYNVSRNPIFNVTLIIKIRGTFFPLMMLLSFPRSVFCMCSKIELGGELGETEFREHKLRQKLRSKRSGAW